MNIFSFSGVLLSISSLILLLILIKYGRSYLHTTWACFNFAIVIWGISCFYIGKELNPERALFWWRISHLGIILIPVFLYNLVYILCKIQQRKTLYVIYAQALAFVLLSFTNFFFPGVRYFSSSFYYALPGPIYPFFTLIWMSIVAYSHYLLFIEYCKSSGIKKNQILYLLFGSCVGFAGGITNFLVGFGVDIYPIGNFTIPIYCMIVTYAILRFRLMDISLVVTRTGIFVAVYSVVLGIPFLIAFNWQEELINIFEDSWWLVPLICSTILATVGPFIYLYIQRRAEERLFQEQNRYQATLRQASLGMGRIKDLRRLVGLIVHIVTRTVRLEHSMIYLNDTRNKKFILGATRSRRVRFVPEESIDYESQLVKELISKRMPVVYDEIKQRTQDYGELRLARMEAELTRLDAALVVPSFIDDNFLAIIILGKKLSGQMYSNDDLAVFSILANQAALAIENAQFYEDIKRTHEQLFKAEKMATIGTMADGLSHQINNRLHALGFIAGDVLDTLNLKKDLPMSPEIKEIMVDIEHALSRIQDNVAQGGEVVQGLLKYSRKGEEGYTEVELDQLINASIEMTQFKIKPGEIKILKEYGAGLPKIKGNFTQLQEVFFNLIDNAYDAMMQRKAELKEVGYQPTININASNSAAKYLDILFEDNGMGIQEDDKDKLFTPFFTTKLSSKKGTGLGLYVIQKLIEQNHGGRVSYQSVYKSGTRVFVRIPTA